MSSNTVSVPKYRHHKGTGQAFVQVQGRRHYLGKWDSPRSKERYAAFVAELAVCPTAATLLPPPSPVSPITVVELCAAYLDFAEVYYVKNGRLTSQVHIIRQAVRTLNGLYGHTPAADFGPLALQAVQTQLIERDLARKTINHLCGTIKRVFRWGVSRELVPVATSWNSNDEIAKGHQSRWPLLFARPASSSASTADLCRNRMACELHQQRA
jgi:hypothetical protein